MHRRISRHADRRFVVFLGVEAINPQSSMTPPRPPVRPEIAAKQSAFHVDLVEEVARAVAAEKVVVVGVRWLQPGKRARRILDAQQIPYRYLQYGSYLSGWRRRLALKIWVGWPTFPLIFVKGTFVGGASDLQRLSDSGALKALLGEQEGNPVSPVVGAGGLR